MCVCLCAKSHYNKITYCCIIASGSVSTTTKPGVNLCTPLPSVYFIDWFLIIGTSPINEIEGSSLTFTMVTWTSSMLLYPTPSKTDSCIVRESPKGSVMLEERLLCLIRTT